MEFSGPEIRYSGVCSAQLMSMQKSIDHQATVDYSLFHTKLSVARQLVSLEKLLGTDEDKIASIVSSKLQYRDMVPSSKLKLAQVAAYPENVQREIEYVHIDRISALTLT